MDADPQVLDGWGTGRFWIGQRGRYRHGTVKPDVGVLGKLWK